MNVSQEQITLLNTGLEEHIKHIEDHFDGIYSFFDFNEILQDSNYQKWLNDFSSTASCLNNNFLEFEPNIYLLKKSFNNLGFKMDDLSCNEKIFNIYFVHFDEKVGFIFKELLSIPLKENDNFYQYSSDHFQDALFQETESDQFYNDIETFILNNIDPLIKKINEENKFYHHKNHSSQLIKERLFNTRDVFNQNNLEHLLLANATLRYKTNIRKFLNV
tara:strand:- start:224 stop:877 length:654 start_codon:yes stop_codon:yes gene_type:complete